MLICNSPLAVKIWGLSGSIIFLLFHDIPLSFEMPVVTYCLGRQWETALEIDVTQLRAQITGSFKNAISSARSLARDSRFIAWFQSWRPVIYEYENNAMQSKQIFFTTNN